MEHLCGLVHPGGVEHQGDVVVLVGTEARGQRQLQVQTQLQAKITLAALALASATYEAANGDLWLIS